MPRYHTNMEASITAPARQSVEPAVQPAARVAAGPFPATATSRLLAPHARSEVKSEVDFLPRPVPVHRTGYELGKRVFDLSLGAVLLIIACPIILAAALFIWLGSKGSPFFVQTRLGRNGHSFKIFKLRGMYIDSKQRFPSYYDYSGKQNLDFCFHQQEDPRVTAAGRFCRKTSIDELPNLWNVVVGDMSLVGPRPEIPEVMALYGSYREEYLSVKPGVTCLSKCTGRDRLTKRETIEIDLGYVRERSFKSDLSILWRTFRSVLLRRDVLS